VELLLVNDPDIGHPFGRPFQACNLFAKVKKDNLAYYERWERKGIRV
jgi:hypothetical protein